MKIKSYAINKPHGKIKEKVFDRKIGERDVLVKIKFVGVGAGDVFILDNFWDTTKYPAVGGYEAIGKVEKVGKDVSLIEEGDIVGVGYQYSSCSKCRNCLEGNEQFCKDQVNTDEPEIGAFADEIIVDERFVFKLSEEMYKPEYVTLMCSGLTVFSAIKKGQLGSKAEVGVVGVGGLGHIGLKILIKQGHSVTGFSSGLSKKEWIKDQGASFINSQEFDQDEHLRSFDLILLTTYSKVDLDKYLEILKPKGKIAIVGLPFDKLCFHSYNLADYAARTIFGSYLGSRDEMNELIEYSKKHDIKSEVEVMPFKQINKAIDKVRKRKVKFKLILER